MLNGVLQKVSEVLAEWLMGGEVRGMGAGRHWTPKPDARGRGEDQQLDRTDRSAI